MLPYFCHNCGRLFFPSSDLKCTFCSSEFVEVFTQINQLTSEILSDADTEIDTDTDTTNDSNIDEHESNEDSLIIHTTPSRHQNDFNAIVRMFLNRLRTIGSDVRNYAIGPEYDEILNQFMEDNRVVMNPCSKDFIDSLDKIESNVECSICLKDDLKDYVRFSCGHMFHYNCAVMWLKVKNTCPNCRKVLDHRK